MIDRAELLSMLRNADKYISGQELCAHFDVSRNAIWKTINQLREDGYQIEAVSNKGYKLTENPDILSEAEISSRLTTKWVARNLVYYAETDSTNIRIRHLSEEGAEEGTLAVADVQNAGRGRRGRSWVTPAGEAIMMSILLKPTISPDTAPMLTLVMALAVCKAIEEVTGLDAYIKWPNDIVVNGKKVCGILTEMNMEYDYIRDVVIGVGINTNQPSKESFNEEYREHASSLRMENGSIVNRASLIATCMEKFETYYEAFIKAGNLELIKDEYALHLINTGKTVRVLDPKGAFEGIARGITELGELIVELEDGSETLVYAGEVSVRGLYGYT